MKAWFEKYPFLPYLGASVLLHIVLVGFFLISSQTRPSGTPGALMPAAAGGGDIVQAVILDEAAVQKEVARLDQEEVAQKREAEQKQKAHTDALEKVKKETERQKADLEKYKQEMLKVKQEEQKRLSEIQLAKEKEKKVLEELKREKEKEKNKIEALDDQRQAEQDRVQQARKEREKEEKKQADSKLRAEEAKRQGAARAAEGQRQAALRQGKIVSEAQRVVDEWGEKIRGNKNEVFGVPPGLKCVLGIRVLPDGSIQVKIVKSSGNTVHDNTAVNAAYKSQPLTLPEDPAIRAAVQNFELGYESGEDIIE